MTENLYFLLSPLPAPPQKERKEKGNKNKQVKWLFAQKFVELRVVLLKCPGATIG